MYMPLNSKATDITSTELVRDVIHHEHLKISIWQLREKAKHI